MFHPIFVNYMEQQIINNGESGLSVRNKINGMFANLISGSEGINAIWKQIGINLNYTAEIGNVETLNATSKAWGEIYITGKKFVFNFGIPQGYDGGMIIIRKTYSSVAEMNADKNPTGDDGITIGGGQIVSVFNSSNPDENAFYSRTADGWKLQLGVVKEFRDEMTSQVNSVKQKADESKANIQSLVNALPVTQTTGDSTTSVMSQKAVTDKINDVYKKSNYNDGDSIIDFNTIHLITDNPEFACVAVDADDRILYGIKTDGQPYFGVGCPQQVKDYIDKQINKILGTDDISSTIDSLKEIEAFLKDFTNSDTLKTLLDTKANKTDVDSAITNINANIADKYKKSNPNDEEGNVVDTNTIFSIGDNPEYIKALTDSVGKLIEAIGIDGIRKFFAGINIQGVGQYVTDNPEYIVAWLDSQDRIIFAIENDGNPYFGYGVPKQIKGFAEDLNTAISSKIDELMQALENAKTDVDKKIHLGDNTYPVDVHKVSENPEYMSVILDAAQKILEAYGVDGIKRLFTAIELMGTKMSTEDNPEFINAKTDSEGKILEAIDNKGIVVHKTKHIFEGGLKTNTSELAKDLKEGGYLFSATDWSDYISNDGENPLNLPEPRCAILNIISDADLTNLSKVGIAPKSDEGKRYNIPVTVQFWDKQGNYFKKQAIISGQGSSSLSQYKKNIALDLFDKDTDGDTFSIKFGNWVAQDSYHLKAFYTDFLRGTSDIAYKIADRIERSRGSMQDRPWKRALLNTTKYVADSYTDLSLQLDTGALCHPDAFPVIIYQNGNFYGVFAWNLKKHRDNYHMDKSCAEHIHLDGVLSNNTIFDGNIQWNQFEIRNPKNLYYKEAHNGTYEYNADIAQAEIAGDEEVNSWINAGQLPDGTKITSKISNRLKVTAKVKNYIIALSKYRAEINALTTDDEKKSLCEKYFDIPGFIDYGLVQRLVADGDSFSKNWQWTTYDGIKWSINEYDKDQSFGNDFQGILPAGIIGYYPTFIIGSNIFADINKLFISETKERAKELIDNGIVSEEAFINIIRDWTNRIGYNNYKREFEKWSETPCNRDNGVDAENWLYTKDIYFSAWYRYSVINKGDIVTHDNDDKVYESLIDKNTVTDFTDVTAWKDVTYNSSKTYEKDDTCWISYSGRAYQFTAKKKTNANPIAKTYEHYPKILGWHDNIWRYIASVKNSIKAFKDAINK